MVMDALCLMFTSWLKHKRFNSHAIKQKLHGSWNTIHPRHDMHTQQRSVHAHHQPAVTYPHAELQPFNRMLQCSVYCTITFAKPWDIVLVGDDTGPVRLCALSDIGLNWIYFHTEPKSNIKLSRSYWVRLKVKLLANISISTCYMYRLYLLVIHISKEFGTYHEAEILSVLHQVSIYPFIRRGTSEGNSHKSPVAFYCTEWLIGYISSAAVPS